MKAPKQGIILLILVGFATTGWGQNKLPIFKEKTDSIEYEKISLRMRELFTMMRDTSNINRDSISTRVSYLMNKATRKEIRKQAEELEKKEVLMLFN
jgi:hypothetical protein